MISFRLRRALITDFHHDARASLLLLGLLLFVFEMFPRQYERVDLLVERLNGFLDNSQFRHLSGLPWVKYAIGHEWRELLAEQLRDDLRFVDQ